MSRPKHGERVHAGQAGISRTKGAHIANPQQTKANRVPRHREDPAVAARRAGDRGRHAEPVPTGHRVQAYERQTGKAELTPKQRRRANKKLFDELRRTYQGGESP